MAMATAPAVVPGLITLLIGAEVGAVPVVGAQVQWFIPAAVIDPVLVSSLVRTLRRAIVFVRAVTVWTANVATITIVSTIVAVVTVVSVAIVTVMIAILPVLTLAVSTRIRIVASGIPIALLVAPLVGAQIYTMPVVGL